MSSYAYVLLVNFTDRLVNQYNHVPEHDNNLGPGKNLNLCESNRVDLLGAVTKLLSSPITDPACQHATHQFDRSDMAFSLVGYSLPATAFQTCAMDHSSRSRQQSGLSTGLGPTAPLNA